MARRIAQAHAEVVRLTLSDDTDIEVWKPDEDSTLRLIRALICGCRAEPSLNAWYDAQHLGGRVLKRIELGSPSIPPKGCSSRCCAISPTATEPTLA